MGLKLKKGKKSTVPGPGNYDPSLILTKENVSKMGGIGTSKRYTRRPQSANPGPGYYNTRGRIKGPKYV